MRVLGALLLALLMSAGGAAFADEPTECRSAQQLVDSSIGLPQVARAIAKKQLTVLVVGAGSSSLPGRDGAAKAYPNRLENALRAALPGVAITVVADIKAGRTAATMAEKIPSLLAADHADLVVWQTGTVDALRAVEIDLFREALDRGLAAARNAGADVVIVNSQYSPRTESIIALGVYSDNIRWFALQQNLPVFDRFSVMKLWSDLGVFDLINATKKLDTAERVHDCIGWLLADLVVGGAKVAVPPGGGQ